ncbi:ATP-binding cassette domain-containing protein [Halomontanus rarus]|uniref:ATP-binding cassette domain-containing protein n=1 Tax=Halomontanus rarus TaxID=3034020 RepID=UPI001A981F56
MSGSTQQSASNPVVDLCLRYGRPHAGHFVVGFGLGLLGRVPQLLPGLIIGVAIDAFLYESGSYALPLVPEAWIPSGRLDQLLMTIGLLIALYLLGTAVGIASRWSMGVFMERFQHDVRVDTYDTVQRLESTVFDERGTGQIMSVLNDDVRQLERLVGSATGLVNLATMAAVIYALLFWLNAQLATFLFLVPVALVGLSFWMSSRIEPEHLEVRERVGEINDRLNSAIEGISVVKSYGTEDRERERVESASRGHRTAQWELLTTKETFRPTMEVTTGAGRVLLLLIGGYWVLFGPPLFLTGTLTVGALYTFFDYTGRFTEPLRWLPNIVDGYQNGKAAATRIVELETAGTGAETETGTETRTEANRDAAIELEDVDGAVAYEHVTFSYPEAEERAVDDVSFAVDPGTTVGIVGPTGAGKSTLTKLLLRFYEPDGGTVQLDGTDVRDLELSSLRESIGYVSQDPFLFSGTVRENVAYARPDLDEADVVRATRLAGAHEFVTDLPDGYETEVGERGVKLSGGQRQRLALARALVGSPPILLLDEATSHVDNETEVVIQRALERASERRTTFLVAHRLSTVRTADVILVVEDGAIVERGTHEELLERDGLYATLWQVQVGAVKALPESYLEELRAREVER